MVFGILLEGRSDRLLYHTSMFSNYFFIYPTYGPLSIALFLLICIAGFMSEELLFGCSVDGCLWRDCR